MSKISRVFHREDTLTKFCFINTTHFSDLNVFDSAILIFDRNIQVNCEIQHLKSLKTDEILIHSDVYYYLKYQLLIEPSSARIQLFKEGENSRMEREDDVEEEENEGEDEEEEEKLFCTFECSKLSFVEQSLAKSRSLFFDSSPSEWKEKLVRRKLLNRRISSGTFIFIDFLEESIPLFCKKTNTSIITRSTSILVDSTRVEEPKTENEEFVGYESFFSTISKQVNICMKKNLTETIWLWGECGVGKSLFLRKLIRKYNHLSTYSYSSEDLIKEFFPKEEEKLEVSQVNSEFANRLSHHFSKPSFIIIDNLEEFLSLPKTSRFHTEEEDDEGVQEENQKRKSELIIYILKRLLDRCIRSKIPSVVIIVANRPVYDEISTKIKTVTYFPLPNFENRKKIIRFYCSKKGMSFRSDIEKEKMIEHLASHTPNYVAKEIKETIQFVFYSKIFRKSDEIIWEDIKASLKHRPPNKLSLTESSQSSQSSLSSSTSPSLVWEDIGGYEKQKNLCKRFLFGPVDHSSSYRQLGLPLTSGILIHGLSGCGKTMFVKALASLGKMNFVSLKCSDLFSMYTGETEKNISILFHRARTFSPCVLFFDEIDALCPSRSEGMSSSSSISDSGVGRRALSQFLTELDGIEGREQVFIIACTNQIDLIDSAILRPGRMDHLVYIPLPDKNDRKEILRIMILKIPFDKEDEDEDIFLEEIAAQTEGFSGADLEVLCKDATWKAFHEGSDWVTKKHFIFFTKKK